MHSPALKHPSPLDEPSFLPLFVSLPPRSAKQPSGAVNSSRPALGPDYKSWTEAGFATSNQERVIKSETWGPSAREMRPPPIDV